MAPSQIQIHINALNRLLKDKIYYKKDIIEQNKTIDDLNKKKESEQDEEVAEDLTYQLKKQVQILNETENLIPSLNKKITEILQNLNDFISENKSSINPQDLSNAETVIKDCEDSLVE
ncbi:hypothetical protein B5S28_g372 [[Candida] boidinii]|uniref:Unnamed protein product n=1 Tax=Candida boidinii TaxID=5477 RepID=A0ACB5U0M2_CANBO|nr:hypothetical protein B5S28_g372 [[Candida] boidinii]OWB62917.1 hypothetical protein B5S29_g3866 [[Candida] boidinii]OWB73774.1 hypothetical protein B5S31_g3536 [[Candida] boidinii]GME81358.1 unnamed protein product [[Candida] boidinii]GME98873.1 unnamed protein product [[Candida] boidinii]